MLLTSCGVLQAQQTYLWACNSCTSWQAGRALLDAGASFAIVATGQLRQNPQ